jgi:ABC-2 type transport system permease protein
MIRVFRAEWLRLRQPLLLGGTTAGVAGFGVLITAVTFALIARNGTTRGFNNRLLGADDLAGPDGFALLVQRAVMILGLVAASVAAGQIGADYGSGVLRSLSVREPNRLRLFAGKLIALCSFTLLVVTSACLGVLGTALLVAPSQGVSTTTWFSELGIVSALTATGNLVLACCGFAALGAALGVILRSAILAIALAAAYGLVEGVIGAFAGGITRWLPGQALSALAQGGTPVMTYGEAALTVTLTVLGTLDLTAMLLLRRDITE